MARSRTTKTLAKRIELDYFKRRHPFRSWRRRLSLLAGAAAVIGVGFALLPGGRIAWSAGELAPAHALFEADCGACHGPAPADTGSPPLPIAAASGPGLGAVRDENCLRCHPGPVHQADQPHTPECASCHREHRGQPLQAVTDAHCTSCHAALTTRSGELQVAVHVGSFPEGHPEFGPVARGLDAGRLRLNHRLHLVSGLDGPDGPVTLTCASCHQAGPSGGLMQPVSYEDHCAACHPLGFDTEGRLPGGPVVPHADPAAVRDFLIDLYADLVVGTPAALKDTDPVAAALARHRARQARLEPLVRAPLSAPAGTETAFVLERVALSLQVLERQTCALCHGWNPAAPHDRTPPAGGEQGLPDPPAVPRPEVPDVWMAGARFSHRAHRAMDCSACHARAVESEQTSDLLLPGIETCAACHGGSHGASADCVTCHRYHPVPTAGARVAAKPEPV